MKKIKRRGLSWLLVMAMVLSGLALPNGQKAKAAETSYDLTVKKGQSPLTIAANEYGTDYIADVIFNVPDDAKEKSKLNASGSRIEITGKINSISSDTGSLQATGIVALSEDGKSVMDSLLFRHAMEQAAQYEIPMFSHCEDKALVDGGVMNAGDKAEELGLPGITNAVEDVIVARDILISKETGAQLHLCHCSTADSALLVGMAKDQGLRVTAEVCPHHFTMSDQEITEDDGRFKMNPPLRSPKDVQALKDALASGVMDVISTDHAPHGAQEKAQSMKKAPFGIVGLETSFALGFTELVQGGYLSLAQLVEKMSVNPARVLGIDKGNLAVGKTADLVIADVEHEYEIDSSSFASMGRNTPFDGKKVTGRVVTTIVDGKIVYEYSR